MTHLKDVRATFLPDLAQNGKKNDYFQEFNFC